MFGALNRRSFRPFLAVYGCVNIDRGASLGEGRPTPRLSGSRLLLAPLGAGQDRVVRIVSGFVRQPSPRVEGTVLVLVSLLESAAWRAIHLPLDYPGRVGHSGVVCSCRTPQGRLAADRSSDHAVFRTSSRRPELEHSQKVGSFLRRPPIGGKQVQIGGGVFSIPGYGFHVVDLILEKSGGFLRTPEIFLWEPKIFWVCSPRENQCHRGCPTFPRCECGEPQLHVRPISVGRGVVPTRGVPQQETRRCGTRWSTPKRDSQTARP